MIQYFFGKYTINSLSFTRINFEYIIFVANRPWIHYLLLEITMNLLSLTQIHLIRVRFSKMYNCRQILIEFLSFKKIFNIFEQLFLYSWIQVYEFLDPGFFWWVQYELTFFLAIEIFDPGMTFLTLSMSLNGHDNHFIRIKIEFGIESYAYHVYMVAFQIYDPKMTFSPWIDLGWPWNAHHWIENKILDRSICISCAFGHVSNFWPLNDLFGLQNDIFDPQDDPGWPWHASFQNQNRMNKIWIDSYAYHVHLALFPIFDPKMTFFDNVKPKYLCELVFSIFSWPT